MGEECKGGGIQPMSQERTHGAGKPGRASVTCSPASGGMQSLLGAIDPSTGSLVLFWLTKKGVYYSYSRDRII